MKQVVEQQIPEALNRFTGTGASLWSASAAWAWLGSNQSSIASVCAILGVALTAYGVFRRPKK